MISSHDNDGNDAAEIFKRTLKFPQLQRVYPTPAPVLSFFFVLLRREKLSGGYWRKKGGWGLVKLMEVRQEGFQGNKGLRLPRLASGREGSLTAVKGKASWCQGPCEQSRAARGLRSSSTPTPGGGLLCSLPPLGCCSALCPQDWPPQQAFPSAAKTQRPLFFFFKIINM